MLPVLSTKRLVLRPYQPADLDALHALWTTPQVRQYLWDDIVISRERAAEEVQRGLENEARHGIGYWAIESAQREHLVGFCGFRPVDQGPEIELMYGLSQEWWGQGLATEACEALLQWLWDSTPFPRVFARTDPPNLRSLAVMVRLGMRLYSTTPTMISYVLERPRLARHLSFRDKQLGQAPDVWEHTDLETLVLSGNGLREVPEALGRLKSLRMLDLGHNQLAHLPEELGDIEGLSDFLYLNDNRLFELPSSLRKLAKLRYLNISQNQFAILPDCICRMANLLELRADANQMTSLPDSIAELKRLRELHLRDNRLTFLPEAIGRLSELRYLDLRGNLLRSLPAGIATLPHLEKLDLRWVSSLAAPAWLAELEQHGCLVYR